MNRNDIFIITNNHNDPDAPTHVTLFRTQLDVEALKQAIREAFQDFLETDTGHQIYKENNQSFNYCDLMHMPCNICAKHGFTTVYTIKCAKQDNFYVTKNDHNIDIKTERTVPAMNETKPTIPPDPLHDATMDGPVELTPENTEKAAKCVAKTISALEFFYERIKSGTLHKADVKTHISLLRYEFNDLNELLDGGQFLSEKLEETMAMLREANKQIKLLETQSGSNVTSVNGQAFIKYMHDAITTWYELSGFHYGSSTTNIRGINLEMSEELEDEYAGSERCNMSLGRKDIAEKVVSWTPWQFGSGYDVQTDGLRMSLLDTDNNRTRLKALFTSVFPDSHIYEFKSYCDRNLYMLRTNVFIPFTDIERWLNKTEETEN